MKRMFGLMAAVVLASVSFGGAAHAASIVNGSFEDGVAFTEPFITLAAGDSTSITGWTVLGNGVDYIGNYWQASDGVRSIDLSALSTGRIYQTGISDMIVGQKYRVNFDMSGNPDGLIPRTTRMVMSVTGGEAELFTYDVTAANSRSNMLWETKSYFFTASSMFQNMQFSSLAQNPFGPVIDNVSIAAVPEPASWAMLITGFGMVGGTLRRRRMPTVLA